MSYTLKITVIGAHTPIGSEVARYGVAIGYDVIGVTPDGEPPMDEPWIHGVVWQSPANYHPEDSYGVVIADRQLLPATFAAAETNARTVGVGFDNDNDAVTVALDVAGVATERAAMAALRCAVEDERSGTYTADEVDHIGDAVMLQ
jgi:hypothetical protein